MAKRLNRRIPIRIQGQTIEDQSQVFEKILSISLENQSSSLFLAVGTENISALKTDEIIEFLKTSTELHSATTKSQIELDLVIIRAYCCIQEIAHLISNDQVKDSKAIRNCFHVISTLLQEVNSTGLFQILEILYRMLFLRESDVQKKDKQKNHNQANDQQKQDKQKNVNQRKNTETQPFENPESFVLTPEVCVPFIQLLHQFFEKLEKDTSHATLETELSNAMFKVQIYESLKKNNSVVKELTHYIEMHFVYYLLCSKETLLTISLRSGDMQVCQKIVDKFPNMSNIQVDLFSETKTYSFLSRLIERQSEFPQKEIGTPFQTERHFLNFVL